MNLLFQTGLSNACFALALAIVATVVGAKARRPQFAHMLWLLVLVKLLTPPIVTIPISISSTQADHVVALGDNREFDTDQQPAISETTVASSLLSHVATMANHAKPWLASIWVLGGAMVLARSLLRVYRFDRLLAAESDVAPKALRAAVERTACRLGLNTIPKIYTTSAHLSPMVWWTGGEVRVVIPATLLDQMDTEQSQWILAHELAHVRRRDYLVRWLEWLACVCFWWNPVVWWAQRNLRATEEICCDELVLSSLSPEPKFYANSLLAAVEFLARPVLRAPAMASEINSGGYLERRFKMIVSENPNRTNSRWLQMCVVLLCVIVVLPLGIASAQDYGAVGRRLREAVAAGELTGEQARIMVDALRKASSAGQNQGSDRAKAYLMKVKKELGEAIEAGRISKEDAARRYEAAEKAIKERMASGHRQYGETGIRREGYARVEAEMDKAVAAGRVSREDARARLNAMRRAMAERGEQGERRITRENYAGIERRVKAAVEAGKMTREEAREKLGGFRRRIETAEHGERGERRISREEYARAEAKMRKMIDEGKAKPEDVERRLIEMRRMMDDQNRRDGEHGEAERPDWENTKRRIEGAVQAGKMTRKEADAKYKEIRERLSHRNEEAATKIHREDWENIKRRIEGAVQAGKMTREEADAKYKEIEERASRKEKR